MHALADALRTAPSSRSFRADPVPAHALQRALVRARLAPGSPWRVHVVADAAPKRALRDAHLRCWHDHLRETGGLEVLATDRPAGAARRLREADRAVQALDDVQAHLVVTAGPGRDPGAAGTFTGDLLRALDREGFGATELPLALRAAGELHALLALGDGEQVAAVVAAGWEGLR